MRLHTRLVYTIPCLCLCLLSTGRAQEAAPASAPRDGTLLLDGTGYFRQYTEFGLMRLNGDILKAEGEKLFGGRLGRLEQDVKRLLQDKAIDWTKADWRDAAVYHFPSIQTGDDSLAVRLLPTVPPPADWAQPDCDDSSFLRQRIGILSPVTAGHGAGRERSSVHRRALYARTYFSLPDPAAAGALTLKLVYRGGARVFVNGEEIGRGHLPAGPVGPDTVAADYAQDAYLANADELPEKKSSGFWVGDLRCPFDMAGGGDRARTGDCRMAYGGSYVNRAGWQRLQKLRDREIVLTVPAKTLRKGVNVLAVEIRTSRYHPLIIPGAGDDKARGWCSIDGANGSLFWDHLRLINVELRAAAASLPTCKQPPQGLTAWVDDPHTRLFDRDFNPSGWPVGTVRIVGAQNGTFAAQIGLFTDKERAGLKATVSDLVGPGNAKIPAAAASIAYFVGHGLDEMSQLGWFRSFDTRGRRACDMSNVALYRYADGLNVYGKLPADNRAADAARTAYLQNFKFFDHLTPFPPERMSPNACQPLWLSWKLPADAAPGAYKGTVTIQADGAAPLAVPVEAEVIPWRVPDPRDFQMNVESEQSPYGVAKAYPCELWSDRHFALMETSFRQLARIGNSCLFVPVLLHSELGNKGDPGPIKWIRRKDGTLTFDYALLDRYLALAQKHQGKPKVVCFVVMHGDQSPSNAVLVFDEASGKTETVEVGPAQEATRGPLWKAFGTALYAHMQTRHLQDSMFFGHAFDDTFDPGLIALMAETVPEAGWAAGGHTRRPDATFRATAAAMGPDLGPASMSGWKSQFLYYLTPRTGGSVICVEGISTPFTWRVWCDRTIYAGMNGLGRVGADYFEGAWFDGFKATGWNQVGRPCVQTLWPGKTGVESSARNEILLEGIQEAEARIFLEQALDRSKTPAAGRRILSESLAAEAQKVLDDHFRSTLYIAAGGVDFLTMDIHGDWQARSRRLFQAAAQVAAAVGLDVDRAAFGRVKTATFQGRESSNGQVGERLSGEAVSVPALGKTRIALRIRNWTATPRAFRAVADKPWIVPEKTAGTVTGQQELGIVLDGKTLQAGEAVAGTLAFTDTASGACYPVTIDARVEKALEYRVRQQVQYETGGGSGGSGRHTVTIATFPVFNVSPGAAEERTYLLANNADTPLQWTIASSQDCLAAEPAAGEISGNSVRPVKLVARPQEREAARLESVLTLRAAGGAVSETYPVTVFAIPAYQAPAAPPAGEAVFLNDLDQKKFVKSHTELGQDGKEERGKGVRAAPCYHRTRGYGENLNQLKEYAGASDKWPTVPYTMSGKTFSRGLWVSPGHATVYAIEGAGFKAFAAEVGFFDKFAQNRGANAGAVVCFEVYVDGKLRAQSGLMGVTDAPRLLVADNLQNAREIKLVTRRDDLSNDPACLCTWGDPRFTIELSQRR